MPPPRQIVELEFGDPIRGVGLVGDAVNDAGAGRHVDEFAARGYEGDGGLV